MQKRQAEIDDLVKARAFNVRQVWSTLTRPVRGSFFAGDAVALVFRTSLLPFGGKLAMDKK